jgi:hypothetical protein
MMGETVMIEHKDIEIALRSVLPSHLHDHIPNLAHILADVANEHISHDRAKERIARDPFLLSVIQALAGNQISTSNALLSFGKDAQLGDVTIRDLAGRDVVNFTIHISHHNTTLASPLIVSSVVIGVLVVVVFAINRLLTVNQASLEETSTSQAIHSAPTTAPIVSNTIPTILTSPIHTTAPRLQGELVVYPKESQVYVGQEHQIIVTLRDLNGFLIAKAAIHLQIVDGPHVGLTQDVVTDQNGGAFFTYRGEQIGTDTIRIWADTKEYESAFSKMKTEAINVWLSP